MATSSLLSLTLCFLLQLHLLLSFHQCLAARLSEGQRARWDECRIESLNKLEPAQRIQHEAGVSEVWDENNKQMQCAGVAVTRHVVEAKGLILPSFNNAPMLIYITQGHGIFGTMVPGCPETFQSGQQSQEGRRAESFRDQHQKVRHFRQGDIVALPAGVAHWFYNDGGNQLVMVVLHDTSNNANQLDQNLRRFSLAGTPQDRQPGSLHGQQIFTDNIFRGFRAEILAESFGVNIETVKKLQRDENRRGFIVNVDRGLQVIRPPRMEEEEERGRKENGLEETYCSMRVRENIADPARADIYSARGGRIATLNSLNLPILRYLRLSAERGVLYRNAMVPPHWNINAHSIIYVTRGRGHIQVVGNSNQPAFDGEVREGELLVVPQNYVVVKQASNEGFEWISFKTNDNAMVSPLAGRTSVFRAIPEDVLVNSYQISREEARNLKYSREEAGVFSPRSTSKPWSVVEALQLL